MLRLSCVLSSFFVFSFPRTPGWRRARGVCLLMWRWEGVRSVPLSGHNNPYSQHPPSLTCRLPGTQIISTVVREHLYQSPSISSPFHFVSLSNIINVNSLSPPGVLLLWGSSTPFSCGCGFSVKRQLKGKTQGQATSRSRRANEGNCWDLCRKSGMEKFHFAQRIKEP